MIDVILSSPGTLLKLRGPVLGAKSESENAFPLDFPALTLGCLDIPETQRVQTSDASS